VLEARVIPWWLCEHDAPPCRSSLLQHTVVEHDRKIRVRNVNTDFADSRRSLTM
jgi:hypothetical protein